MPAKRKNTGKPEDRKRAPKSRSNVKKVTVNEDVSELAARLMLESEREDVSQAAVRIVSEEISE
jgi:hypothetical protein